MNELQKVQEENRKMKVDIEEMKKTLETLTEEVRRLGDTRYKTSAREIINHEVQFKQKVYRADGTLVTQINT